MNDLETRLREALQSAPTPAPSISDPVATVERRVKRARAAFAAGASVAVLVIAAAIAVPLQLTGSHRDAPLAGHPSPVPSATTAADAPTSWPAQGSEALTEGGGSLWSLRPVPQSNSGALFIDRLDPRSHAHLGEWGAVAPATWLFYGLDRVWLTGGGDGAYPDGLLQVLNPATGKVHTLTSVHQQLSGVAFAAGHAWVLAGRSVWEVDTTGRHIGSVSLPVDVAQLGIVSTDSGELWVAGSDHTWLRIDPSSRRVDDSVVVVGPMLGPAGGAAIWTYQAGRLVALSPSLLHQGQSVAEGQRIPVPGAVAQVARSADGGLFVLGGDGPDSDTSTPTLYYLSAAALAGSPVVDGSTPSVTTASWLPVAPDEAGGVNYLSDQDGMHWTP